MNVALAYIAGVIFGLGLLVSRMANPAKVISFLNFGGPWDGSLALVMAAAVGVAALAFRWTRHRKAPLLADRFPPLPFAGITTRLLAGAAIFGVGWGLSGLCPGPAIVDLPLRPVPVAIFIVTMVVGMRIVGMFDR